jgi:hypothetical protein
VFRDLDAPLTVICSRAARDQGHVQRGVVFLHVKVPGRRFGELGFAQVSRSKMSTLFRAMLTDVAYCGINVIICWYCLYGFGGTVVCWKAFGFCE